jgi:hypothetical protein
MTRAKINPPKPMPTMPADARARFDRFVKPVGSHWVWTGHTDDKGYGQFWIGKSAQWAHRVAYVLFVGPLADGEEVGHSCNNPSCVNPEHLCKQSKSENVAEGNRRGGLRGAVKQKAIEKAIATDPSVELAFSCPACGGWMLYDATVGTKRPYQCGVCPHWQTDKPDAVFEAEPDDCEW